MVWIAVLLKRHILWYNLGCRLLHDLTGITRTEVEMRLCYGTFGQVLLKCSGVGVDQDDLCLCLMRAIEPQFEFVDLVNDPSRYSRCMRALPRDIIQGSRRVNAFSVIDYFQAQVLPFIDSNKYKCVVTSLIRIIIEDNEITEDTSLYATRIMTKNDLLNSTSIRIEEFLGSIFLYVVRNVKNEVGKSSVRLVTDAYIKDSVVGYKELRVTSRALSATDENDMKTRWGAELIAESGGVCPNSGCSRPFITQGPSGLLASYEVISIDDNMPSSAPANLIAVCPRCASWYAVNREQNARHVLRETKESMVKNIKIRGLLAEQTLENDIIEVLANIPLTQAPEADLNYIPVELARKMKPESNGLLHRLCLYVDLYYQVVQDALQNLNRNGKNRFEPFCHKVRIAYLTLQDVESNQEAIFEHMVVWLQKETNGKREACEIVIAYFVQKCEVFNAIAQ